MKRVETNMIWGLLLIALGLLFFLQTLGLVGSAWGIVWGLAFAAAGGIFTWRFWVDRTGTWWAVIPGFTLVGVGVLTLMAGFGMDAQNGPVMGALFLAAIGASFAVVYWARRDFWWAIIPGGAMLTFALIALISTWYDGPALGALFFFGLGATFAALYFVPVPTGRPGWSLIPAGVLGVLGVLVLLTTSEVVNYAWAVALILAGIYLLYRQWSGGTMARRH